MRQGLRVVRQTVILDFAELRAIYTWRTWSCGWLLRLLAQASFFGLIGKLTGAEEGMRYVLVGNIVVLVCLESTIVVISMVSERRSGTLPLLAIAPVSHVPQFLGRGLHWVVTGLATSTISWLLLPVLLNVPLPWPNALAALPVIAAIAVSSYGYGCFLAGLALRFPGLQWLVLNLGYLTVMAFCGVNVPRAYWPSGLETATDFLPVSHGLTAIRDILSGSGFSSVLPDIGLELLVGTAWFGLAWFSIARLVIAGRRNGSLEFAG